MCEAVRFRERAPAWIRVSLCIFLVSGLLKLMSAVGSARILLEPDPIFGVRNREVFLAVGTLELVIVAVLATARDLRWRLILIAAVSTDFLLYRFGLWWLGISRPCPCLGSASAWTHVDPRVLDVLTKAALAWLLATSYIPLMSLLSERRCAAAGAA